jgi:hypothetical protein
MDASMATLCINLGNEEVEKLRAKNPHDAVQGWLTFTVFVNRIGRARLVEGGAGSFPEGTIIVKEAHAGDDPESSLMMTAMVKREAGYARESGDWEYFLLTGGAKQVRERGSIPSCVGCHTTQSKNDFVYADYIKK